MSMPVIHSRKTIEITLLGRWVASMILCEQCAAWARGV